MASGQYAKIYLRKIRPLSWLLDEKVQTHKYLKTSFKRIIYRFILKSHFVDSFGKFSAHYKLQRLQKIYFISKLNSRCFNTGRTKFVLRKLSLSRVAIRRYSFYGKLPNICKFLK